MYDDGCYTYCGESFTIYQTIIVSLCCIPKANVKLVIPQLEKKKKKKRSFTGFISW